MDLSALNINSIICHCSHVKRVSPSVIRVHLRKRPARVPLNKPICLTNFMIKSWKSLYFVHLEAIWSRILGSCKHKRALLKYFLDQSLSRSFACSWRNNILCYNYAKYLIKCVQSTPAITASRLIKYKTKRVHTLLYFVKI